MKYILYRCCLSIALFLNICPSIFSGSLPDASVNKPTTNIAIDDQQELTKQTEAFCTQLAEEIKKDNQSISFCLQQLCQTIIAGKLGKTTEEKTELLKRIQEIQEFNSIIDLGSNQNSPEILIQCILFNHILIEYLLSEISKNLATLNIQKVIEQIQTFMTKKSKSLSSAEEYLKMIEKNHASIEKLIYATDRIGLTWYNTAYRTLKKYNTPAVIKTVAIIGATALIAGTTGLNLEWHKLFPWIGKLPRLQKNGAWSTIEYDENGNQVFTKDAIILPKDDLMGAIHLAYESSPEKNPQITPDKIIKQLEDMHGKPCPLFIHRLPLNFKDATIFQKIHMATQNLTAAGLISIGALINFSYKELLAWMYQEPANFAKEKFKKLHTSIDKKLDGVAKKDISKNGYEKLALEDMIGCDDLKEIAQKIANFMKYPERYERAQIEEHRGILLAGPPQCGKTFFAKILRSLIAQEFNDEKDDIHFIDAKQLYEQGAEIDWIFKYAALYAPCIIFIDELDLFGVRRDKDAINTSKLLTCMQGIDIHSQKVIVLATTNKPDQIDPALLADGRFGKVIHINYPSYADRKAYLQRELNRRCIQLNQNFIDCMAQETEGASYNMLKRIITEAIILSSIQTRAVVQEDFEKTLDTEIRHMQAPIAMSETERRIVATYQAGKAVARHILQTTKQVVKITVNPVNHGVKMSEAGLTIAYTAQKASENDKLQKHKDENNITIGEVFTKAITNQTALISDNEFQKEAMALLAGHAALKIFFNDPYTQCNKQDRAEAMRIIYSLISHGEQQDKDIKDQATKIKTELESQVAILLEQHKDLICKIADSLMTKTIIDRYEWEALISN